MWKKWGNKRFFEDKNLFLGRGIWGSVGRGKGEDVFLGLLALLKGGRKEERGKRSFLLFLLPFFLFSSVCSWGSCASGKKITHPQSQSRKWRISLAKFNFPHKKKLQTWIGRKSKYSMWQVTPSRFFCEFSKA